MKINGVRRFLQDLTRPYDWLYELKKVFPSSRAADYFIESRIGPTNTNASYTNVRTIYGLLVGQSYDDKTESGVNTGKISSAISIEITWLNNLSSTHVLECYIIHSRTINVYPNGTTLLIE